MGGPGERRQAGRKRGGEDGRKESWQTFLRLAGLPYLQGLPTQVNLTLPLSVDSPHPCL